MRDDYKELNRRIRAAGLMDRQPLHYTIGITANMLLLGGTIALLALFRSPWAQVPIAMLLGFALAQIAFMFHDAGHRQIAKRGRGNAILGIFFGNLCTGISYGWWVKKHNEHHANPNHADLDPDIDIPVLAFSPEQALEKRGIARFMVAHQAWFFFPLLFFVTPGQHYWSARFLMAGGTRYRMAEIAAMLLHPVLYIGAPLYFLGPWSALIVVLVSQGFAGFYMSSVFAPNHKGMLMIDDGMEIDPVRVQVLTARNVRPNPFIDLWYGGLNYQIEHHLFPSLPRNRLGEARRIVKAFCAERGISYHETSVLTSYKEIIAHLHETSAVLRAPEQARST